MTSSGKSSKEHTSRAIKTTRRQWGSLAVVLGLAALLRLALFSTQPGLTTSLNDRVELADPFLSWKSLLKTHQSIWHGGKENIGTFYRGAQDMTQDGILAGDGRETGVERANPTPIFLWLLKPFLSSPLAGQQPTASPELIKAPAMFFTALDVVAAFCIFQIAALRLRSPVTADVAGRRQIRHRLSARHLLNSLTVSGLRQSPDPIWLAAFYALNPLSVMTCLAQSGTVLVSTLVVFSTWAAMAGRSLLAVTGISIAGAISFHPLLLLPPIWIMSVYQTRFWRHHTGRRIGQRKADSVVDWIAPVMGTAICLTALATFSAGFIADAKAGPGSIRGGASKYDWQGLLRLYRGFVVLPSLTPSLSVWWYFFVEIFDDFRNFFLLVFNAHILVWTVPICIRFRHDALFALFLLLGVQTIFKPYPTAGDVSLYLCLAGLFPAQASYLRTPLPTVLMCLYSAFLVPFLGHLFLNLGSANANFLYAAGLVGTLGGIMGWIDWAWSGGRYLWELERECGIDEVLEEDREELEQLKSGLEKGAIFKRTVVQL